MSSDKKVEDRYTRVFAAYDIRGIVGDDLDSPTVRAISKALLEEKRKELLGQIK